MAYIGNTQLNQNYVPAIDYFSGNGSTTAFTLSRPVASVAQVQAVIENVPQNPGDAYTVSGNTITFTSAPPSGTNNIYIYYTSPNTQVVQPGQGTVTPSSLTNSGPYWDTFGNVGIGTTNPPVYGSGGKTLAIAGQFFPNVGLSATNSSVGNKNYRWIARDDSNGGPIMQFQALDDSWGSEQNIWFVSRSTTGIPFQAWYTGTAGSNAERMRIDSAGNVGIGTSSPTQLLTLSSGATPRISLKDTRASVEMQVLADNVAGYSGTVTNYPYIFVTNNAERMRIDSSGNVQLSTANTSVLNSSGRRILNQTGSILQVVSATTAIEVSSSSGTYVDTGLTATITPSSTSSRILVIAQQVGCGKINDVTLQLKLLRNTTDLMWLERSGGWTATATRNFFGTCGCSFLDSPGTTSAVTYKTQMAAFSPAATVFTQYNVGAGNPTSTITLLEIAG